MPLLRRWMNLCETKDAAPSLADVYALAQREHINLKLDSSDSCIMLQWIERDGENQNGARQVVGALCDYADQARKGISLELLYGSGRLMNYYKSFGFRIAPEDEALVNAGYWDSGAEGDGEPGPEMYRTPRTGI